MTDPNQIGNVKELMKLQESFRAKFSLIKKSKDALLKLFRQKLEGKKVEEIKKDLFQKTLQ